MEKHYWKIVFSGDGESDTIYIDGADKKEAEAKFAQHYGTVPDHLITWSEVKHSDIPDDEAVL